MSDTVSLIEQRLTALSPQQLLVRDDSHLHAGHAGARAGGGHYQLTIVSQQFSGLNRLARHRLVYQTLGDLMQNRIHALAILALAPEES
ncbi:MULTISPECIES: BolA family transcriptional regulator [unclassified Paludibacterium]|uniref:BolA family protein n=1 Tax=unclassified Paludibacterium TaxID=2618429 RepID=UPI001C053B8B|nr:BolA family protein [Paludibacterium sp. B53371]BEV71295.1 BolA family transcriptional regulator [Paludibacterium sp. THUN1379]